MSILYIHCRKGLYQLTTCKTCGYCFECQNCSAKLTTYRKNGTNLDMLCHQCQTNYKYPDICPKCKSKDIISKFGGIEDLAEYLENYYQEPVFFVDKGKIGNVNVHTRLFDPSLDYSQFSKIILWQSQNLLASTDYMVTEEITKNLCEIMIQIQGTNTELVFDQNTENLEISQKATKMTVMDFYENMLTNESKIRKVLKFPPFYNFLLLTSHEKTSSKAIAILESVRDYLKSIDFEELTIANPYPAKFLKRKNLFSYHLLLKYPKQYSNYEKLQKLLFKLQSQHGFQIRLNPKNLF